MAEHRRMPVGGVDRQPDNPAEEQVVVDLLHQLPFRADREKRLQQGRSQQHLGRDGRPSNCRTQRLKPPVQRRQHRIRQQPDRPQRMIRRNPLLQPDIAEHPLTPIIPSPHRKSLQAHSQSESQKKPENGELFSSPPGRIAFNLIKIKGHPRLATACECCVLHLSRGTGSNAKRSNSVPAQAPAAPAPASSSHLQKSAEGPEYWGQRLISPGRPSL